MSISRRDSISMPGSGRQRRRIARILSRISNVSGKWRASSSSMCLATMLHQAFLLGAIYEIDMFGMITKRLFENLNTRFYNSSSLNKFVTMIYGEISQDCTFRFLSAAHPPPVVFSSQNYRFMEVSADLC